MKNFVEIYNYPKCSDYQFYFNCTGIVFLFCYRKYVSLSVNGMPSSLSYEL